MANESRVCYCCLVCLAALVQFSSFLRETVTPLKTCK